jgi:selenophosphate synthetase-related protein
MPRFLIERDIPGASQLTGEELVEIARKSNASMQSLGVPYRWITSYVAGDKVYCIHEADDEEAVREHARRGGFPANVVSAVTNEFGPSTAGTAPAEPVQPL